ncbi:MAG: class I SAM-dependent methyltransferase [Polyangiaceae bacterium]
MKFDEAAKALDGIPYTSPSKGWTFYDLVMQRRPQRILELGFAHGVSTCYFAAAAQELPDCRITAVDIEPSRDFKPPIEELTTRLGFSNLVEIYREKSSYTWFLKKEIARATENGVCRPRYDFVFIDGPKDWTNDGCAFFLADKLLRPGGTIMFDDCGWSYAEDERQRGKKHERGYIFEHLSEDERNEAQIKAVFELLVMQHPNYDSFEIVDDQLAMARKSPNASTQRELLISTRYSLKYRAMSRARALSNRLLRGSKK